MITFDQSRWDIFRDGLPVGVAWKKWNNTISLHLDDSTDDPIIFETLKDVWEHLKAEADTEVSQ